MPSNPATHTFVLVHGAWHGGWCRRQVTDRLAAHGHHVFAPTLTGLGERRTFGLPCGHMVMREKPNELADILEPVA